MRRLLALLLCLSFAAPMLPASAAAQKQLRNLKGNVAYQLPRSAVQPLAARGSVVLSDNAYAITGANSLAGIDLPDSSRVLIGSLTKVQLVAFNQSNIAHASFVIVGGRVRFTVVHPRGARANYTFQTPTAQIAVRGTVGDIDVEPSSLQVNVYQLSSPNLPVRVTLNDGRVFVLHAGQSLMVHFGVLSAVAAQAKIEPVNGTTYQPFSQFGLPANASALGLAAPLHVFWRGLLAGVVVQAMILTLASHVAATPAPANPTVPVHIH